MRDSLKDDQYWEKFISTCDEMIEAVREEYNEGNLSPEACMEATATMRSESFEKMSAIYSAGFSFDRVRPMFSFAVSGLAEFFHCSRQWPDFAREQFFFPYNERTRYLALAILFNADRETVDKIVEAVDFWPGKDAIWEKMIAYLGVTDREPVETIQWPEAYESLWHCFICPQGDRPAQLKYFVENWYKEMKKGDEAWVDSHNNKHDVYFGYWCFEAAGVAKMLDIDDSALKDHPHYPYDLVHPELEG